MKTRKRIPLIITAAMSLFIISGCSFLNGTGSTSTSSGSICSNYSNTTQNQLETKLIHKMTELYRNSTGKQGSKSIQLSVETLKQFLYHLENQATTNGVPIQELGIRIYFARYPKKSTWSTSYSRDLSGFLSNTTTEKYALNNTVIIIPTKKIGNEHYDFNPLDIDTYSGGLDSDYDVTDNLSSSILQFALTIDPTTSAQNHGQMYPPFPEDGMFFK